MKARRRGEPFDVLNHGAACEWRGLLAGHDAAGAGLRLKAEGDDEPGDPRCDCLMSGPLVTTQASISLAAHEIKSCDGVLLRSGDCRFALWSTNEAKSVDCVPVQLLHWETATLKKAASGRQRSVHKRRR